MTKFIKKGKFWNSAIIGYSLAHWTWPFLADSDYKVKAKLGEKMKIIDLNKENKELIEQAATILYESFKDISEAWSTMELALGEVYESIGENRISRIAVNDDKVVLGWIGGKSMYNGNVWELHPLVVKREFRGQGIGKDLVNDLEEKVRERGGLTIWVGS